MDLSRWLRMERRRAETQRAELRWWQWRMERASRGGQSGGPRPDDGACLDDGRTHDPLTGQPPVVDRGAVGFGSYHYRYASGREGDAPAAAFAMRKAAISVYFMDGLGPYADRLARLGPHKAAVGCLYVKSLAEIDLEVLESMITESYAILTAGTYGHRARESESGRPD